MLILGIIISTNIYKYSVQNQNNTFWNNNIVNKDFYRSIENQFRFPVASYLHLIDFLDLQGGTNYLFR